MRVITVTTLLFLSLIATDKGRYALDIQDKSGTKAPLATAAEAAGSFRDIPILEQPFIDTTPAAGEDGLPVGELNVKDGKKAEIVQLAKEIGDGKYGNYDSLLIKHKGKLVFESYFKRGRINLAHGQASATKGYTSLILGRAIQLGYLTMADLDKPLVSFLNELDPSRFVEGAELITLHKALTMTSGVRISREQEEEFENDPSKIKGQRHLQAILEHSAPITLESQTYLYGYGPVLVMQVIDAVVPGTAQDFIKKEILDKLDITNYRWRDHISGLPESGWRVGMTSRDMLKLGSIVVNNGKWNGEQFVPAAYIEKATAGLVIPTQDWMPDNFWYGYFWYYTPIKVEGKSIDVTFAWGGGGQRVITVKDLGLTIAVTGHDRDDETIMPQILERVIPAFVE